MTMHLELVLDCFRTPLCVTSASPDVEAVTEHWSLNGPGERFNYQMFLTELCELIGGRSKFHRPKPFFVQHSQ